MATVREVARRAGVSVGTVSNVLAGSTTVAADLKGRVERAIRELDYRPNHVARSLRTRRSHTLGMVISDITNPFFPEIVRGAEDAARERGYVLATFNTDDRVEREREVFRILESRRVDGVLLVLALPRGDVSHVRDLLRAGTPVVCLDRVPQNLDVDTVSVDNQGGARACVEHLLAQGARRIAYVGGDPRMYIARERLAGYRAALKAAGIPYDRRLAAEGDFRQESGCAQALRLLRLTPRPQALFSANMPMTLGVLRAMDELGLEAPRDLLLATFDHLAFTEPFRPRLTCVVQPTYQIGYQGVVRLIERARSKGDAEPARHLVLPVELRIRGSTQRPPGRCAARPDNA